MAWSNAAAVWGRVTLAIGSWVAARWQWFIITAAVVAAYFLGRSQQKPSVLRRDFPEKEKADAEAESRKTEILEELHQQETRLAKDAAALRKDAVKDLADDSADAKRNSAVTDYLKQVGEEVRR